MTHELLGNHKPSAEWYTPDHIWSRLRATFGTNDIYDPCPIRGTLVLDERISGLEQYWGLEWSQNVYVNPPTPAKPWARKALGTVKIHKDVNIIFAAFSESVLWQVNELMDYPVCWVRNRIQWIDGNSEVKGQPNPNYCKPAKSPRSYNAFVLLSQDPECVRRFCDNFGDLGTIRRSEVLRPARLPQ